MHYVDSVNTSEGKTLCSVCFMEMETSSLVSVTVADLLKVQSAKPRTFSQRIYIAILSDSLGTEVTSLT